MTSVVKKKNIVTNVGKWWKITIFTFPFILENHKQKKCRILYENLELKSFSNKNVLIYSDESAEKALIETFQCDGISFISFFGACCWMMFIGMSIWRVN